MKTKDLTLTAMLTAVIAVCAIITVPLPFTPVPISLLVLGLFLAGGVLKKQYAALAALLYLLLGVVGVPIFSGFQAGPGVLFGPTGGYLAASPLMAFVTAWVIEKMGRNRIWSYFAGMAVALIVCYAFGTAWLAIYLKSSFQSALASAVVPFVLPDLVKLAVASPASLALSHALAKLETRLA